MADDPKDDPKAKAAKAAPKIATVRLHHESEQATYMIGLGEQFFDVVDGEVEVPTDLVESARLLGFR